MRKIWSCENCGAEFDPDEYDYCPICGLDPYRDPEEEYGEYDQ
jgi:rubredoxin